MTADRIPAARRDQGVERHHPRRDPPVIAVRLRIAPRRDQQAAIELGDVEDRHAVALIIFIALAALEQRIGLQGALVQKRDMARIDAALDRLEEVALLQALRDIALLGRHQRPFEARRGGLQFRRPHIGPDDAATLEAGIGFELDPAAHPGFFGLGGQVGALAVHVVFPTVIGAAQPALLVPPEPERDAAMGAELVDQPDPVLAVAEGNEPLAQELDAHRRTIRRRKLVRAQGREPIAPHQISHRGARGDFGQLFVFSLGCGHSVTCKIRDLG